MSTFKPRKFNDEVNISTRSPIAEFSSYLFKAVAFFVILYFSLGLILNAVIIRLPVKQEVWLWNKVGIAKNIAKYSAAVQNPEIKAAQSYVDDLFNRIPNEYKPKGYPLNVKVIDTDDINAFALPGGTILITTGILEFLESENALAYVISHEIGHIHNRDHLRGLGFPIISMVLNIALSGQDGGIIRTLNNVASLSEMSYAREHETQADTFALEALNATYGHVGGSIEFFEKMSNEEGTIEKMIPTLMRTHPHNDNRTDNLKAQIKKKNYRLNHVTPIKRFEKNDQST